MNFLSHYYIDQTNEDAFYVLGLVLPDLVRNAYHQREIMPEKKEDIFFTSLSHIAIKKGWERHLFVDKIFHSSTFFKNESRSLFELFNPVVKSTQIRASFLGHIALELMLDHLLLTENKVNIDGFYHQLRHVDLNEVYLFIEKNGSSNPQKYIAFHQKFVESAYLYTYVTIERVVYALQKICKQVWPNALQDSNHRSQLWVEILEAYKKELTPKWEIFFIKAFTNNK